VYSDGNPDQYEGLHWSNATLRSSISAAVLQSFWIEVEISSGIQGITSWAWYCEKQSRVLFSFGTVSQPS
jgi:hypothetical protein